MKVTTLVIVNDGERVLLGFKKRGFGQGKWNGFGGKVQTGESIEQAAHRELSEEAGIIAHDLREIGLNEFYFDDDTEDIRVHIFCATSFRGEPKETEEMKPRWFFHHEIPYREMWADDEHWFPHFLEGSMFEGKFRFRDVDTLLEHEVKTARTLLGDRDA